MCFSTIKIQLFKHLKIPISYDLKEISKLIMAVNFTPPPVWDVVLSHFVIPVALCNNTLFLLQSAMVCYYKVRQVLQSVTILLQSATIITKCDSTDVMLRKIVLKNPSKLLILTYFFQQVQFNFSRCSSTFFKSLFSIKPYSGEMIS